jgi:hypothetical protein
MIDQQERSKLGTEFDRILRSLEGRADVIRHGGSTVRHLTPVTDFSQTWIVRTYRAKDEGDHVFLEYIGTEGSVRIALPPAVAQAIARQRDALTDISRSRAAKAEAARRKAAGIEPGFKKKRKASGKPTPAPK